MRYLGLDLGAKSLGIALSDQTGTIASFYKNIKFTDQNKMLEELKEIIDKEQPDKIILGYPKNMDNSEGGRAKETKKFKETLAKIYHQEIILEDERLTTKVATQTLIEADLSRKKRKKIIDGVSAVLILQSYLDRKDRI